MNEVLDERLDRYERWLGMFILLTTPLVISLQTVDSFILPKIIWLTIWVSLWLFVAVWRGSPRLGFFTPVDAPLLALFVVFIVSIGLYYLTALQFRALLNFSVFAAVFFLFRRLWRLGLSPERAAGGLLGLAVLIAIYGLAQDYGWDFNFTFGGVRDWRAKVIATLGNPNFLAGYLADGLPLYILFALRPGVSQRGFIICLAGIVLIVACLAVTFCVGAVIGLTVAGLTGAGMAWRLRARPRTSVLHVLLLVVGMTAAVSWYVIDNPYNSHGGSLYREAQRSPQWRSGFGARWFNWRTTRIMIDDHPWTGIGYGNYLTRHIHYQGINYQRYGTAHDRNYVIPVDQPHFQLLETAAETGPAGVLALGWLFFAWGKAAARRLAHDRRPWFGWGAFLGVIVAVAHSFASFPFHLPASSLLVVFLASYPVADLKPERPVRKPFSPQWRTGAAGLALLNVIAAYSLWIGEVQLRKGIEAHGLEAIVHLEQARFYNPFSFQLHQTLGISYSEQGWYQRALDAFARALVFQEDLTSHWYRSQIFQQQNRWQEAIQEQRRVVELNPVFPGHYRELAGLLRRNGEDAEAEKMDQHAEALETILKQRR